MDLGRELKIGEIDLVIEFTREERERIIKAVTNQTRLLNEFNPYNERIIMNHTIDFILKCMILEFGKNDPLAVRLKYLRKEEWIKQSRRLLGIPDKV